MAVLPVTPLEDCAKLYMGGIGTALACLVMTSLSSPRVQREDAWDHNCSCAASVGQKTFEGRVGYSTGGCSGTGIIKNQREKFLLVKGSKGSEEIKLYKCSWAHNTQGTMQR